LLPLLGGCSARASSTALPARCDADAGSCLPKAKSAAQLGLNQLAGLAVDPKGAVYAAGTLVAPGRTFDSFQLEYHGGTDVFVGRYDPEKGKAEWARSFGDVGEQQPSGIAVADGTVLVAGSFLSRITDGKIDLMTGNSVPKAFLLGLRAKDGASRWAHAFEVGPEGGLAAAAAQPGGERFAVCGRATVASDLVEGARAGGDR